MEGEATVFSMPSYLDSIREPSTVVPELQETTRAPASPKQLTDNRAVSTRLGVAELILRLISIVSYVHT